MPAPSFFSRRFFGRIAPIDLLSAKNPPELEKIHLTASSVIFSL
jgi:hypothetical protein